MTVLEEKKQDFIYKSLNRLKNLGAEAFKIEFESGYLPEDECVKLSNVIKESPLKLAVKLGGFSSVRDITTSFNIGADVIIAPMIESAYALEKFVKSASVVCGDKLFLKELFINIETVSAIRNFDEIVSSKYMEFISGITVGRSDLASSLKRGDEFINSFEMFDLINPVCEYCYKTGRKFVIGGCVSAGVFDFISKFVKNSVFGFETRKIFFKCSDIFDKAGAQKGVRAAIEFEIYYLENFVKPFCKDTSFVQDRIKTLGKRILALES